MRARFGDTGVIGRVDAAMAVRTRERDRPMARPIEQDVLQPGTRAIGTTSRGGRTVVPEAELVLGKSDAVEGPPLRPEVCRPGRSSGDADRVLVVLEPERALQPALHLVEVLPEVADHAGDTVPCERGVVVQVGEIGAAEKPTELELHLVEVGYAAAAKGPVGDAFEAGRFRAVPSRSVGETKYGHPLEEVLGPGAGSAIILLTEVSEEALGDLAIVDVGLVDAGLRDVAVGVLQAVGRRRIVDASTGAIDLAAAQALRA